jgi:hypothetical protein
MLVKNLGWSVVKKESYDFAPGRATVINPYTREMAAAIAVPKRSLQRRQNVDATCGLRCVLPRSLAFVDRH